MGKSPTFFACTSGDKSSVRQCAPGDPHIGSTIIEMEWSYDTRRSTIGLRVEWGGFKIIQDRDILEVIAQKQTRKRKQNKANRLVLDKADRCDDEERECYSWPTGGWTLALSRN
ncbi:hypothetical protein K443DRAFT_124824 [Laccaria amethystina LaAM-08-1]|uniref:Uncharacterized protein n=1 Tax=Laccaria amethystina LaAM-08-1 TaxID=1095629 RepID=A0A0C9XCN9_9AGAR|nr:hypothetical protein K443DRAFT_124824 [Laccaria amethystina LaAM-08-1]